VVVCSCHRVSSREVADVVAEGAARVGHVVRRTKAGTDCAGCLPALRELCEAYFSETNRAADMLSATG
jgi:bacterioferritin-associated ferredoxin